MKKFLRPSNDEINDGTLCRYAPSLNKKIYFPPEEILSMWDHALQEILDLSDEGIKNVQAEARWLKRHNDKKETPHAD